ncbi:MAG: DNA-directed polymerase, partial [Humibacillus sp.]|nr:DNA-directed polymerase [Humibacillus sp.]
MGDGVDEGWPSAEVAPRFTSLSTRLGPRWVVWSAGSTLRGLIGAGVVVPRTWDLAETHRVLHGGWAATPGHVLAACRGLDPQEVPTPAPRRLSGFDGDLFDTVDEHEGPLTRDGHLRADALTRATDPRRMRELGTLALECQAAQLASLHGLARDGSDGGGGVGSGDGAAGDRLRLERSVWSESATAVLCLELERDGLPVDRLAAEDLISASAGPRPRDEADVARVRAERDRAVLRHAAGRERTDLRNPTQVRELLAAVGVDVPNTRAWVLEPYRHTHPLVEALLRWRKDERIATTYGYRWLDEHVGADDRLRGAWTACDGAAGRMTAQNGLHNLPAPLRPAVRAAPGHVFVRADLGQVEPRVLAVVRGDPALAEAAREVDMYTPVAAALGVDRPTAKVAVLAAMYGQTSGTAGRALERMQAAYPRALGFLSAAEARGREGGELRTWGGRLLPLGTGGRGRFARNAVVQGA